MDERGAKEWLEDHDVPRETIERLSLFVRLLIDESSRQNLLSKSTLTNIWSRHVVDSAQLTTLADPDQGAWIDLGSGAGFPGIVIALLVDAPVILVESRRLRAEWLQRVIEHLAIKNAEVFHRSVETVKVSHIGVITARAFAPLPKLFAVAHPLSNPETLWLLPKGRGAVEELASIAATWHGAFTMVPSVTDPDSAIIVGRGVRPGIAPR